MRSLYKLAISSNWLHNLPKDFTCSPLFGQFTFSSMWQEKENPGFQLLCLRPLQGQKEGAVWRQPFGEAESGRDVPGCFSSTPWCHSRHLYNHIKTHYPENFYMILDELRFITLLKFWGTQKTWLVWQNASRCTVLLGFLLHWSGASDHRVKERQEASTWVSWQLHQEAGWWENQGSRMDVQKSFSQPNQGMSTWLRALKSPWRIKVWRFHLFCLPWVPHPSECEQVRCLSCPPPLQHLGLGLIP
jgi:hypothetical protein